MHGFAHSSDHTRTHTQHIHIQKQIHPPTHTQNTQTQTDSHSHRHRHTHQHPRLRGGADAGRCPGRALVVSSPREEQVRACWLPRDPCSHRCIHTYIHTNISYMIYCTRINIERFFFVVMFAYTHIHMISHMTYICRRRRTSSFLTHKRAHTESTRACVSCKYVYACSYICIHTRSHTHVHASCYRNINKCAARTLPSGVGDDLKRVCTHIHGYTHTHTHTQIWGLGFKYICVNVNSYILTHKYIHTYIQQYMRVRVPS
jgi:hypothetical protein